MLDLLGPLPRDSDHGPDTPAVVWACPQCSGEYPERPADREMARCSEPGCELWLCPACRETSKCAACCEPFCLKHLRPTCKACHGLGYIVEITSHPVWGDQVQRPECEECFGTPELLCACCVAEVTCPRCGAIRDIENYDFGVDPQTGYSDSGRACGSCIQRARKLAAAAARKRKKKAV